MRDKKNDRLNFLFHGTKVFNFLWYIELYHRHDENISDNLNHCSDRSATYKLHHS